MNLNRIELGVLESNTRALKLYEKVEFNREGVKRQSIYKNGKFVDMIMMAILKEEFTENYKNTTKRVNSLLNLYYIFKMQAFVGFIKSLSILVMHILLHLLRKFRIYRIMHINCTVMQRCLQLQILVF